MDFNIYLLIDNKIDICFNCSHMFTAHKIFTTRTGVQKYRTSIRCNVDMGDSFICNCQAGFSDLSLSLTYTDTSTD